MDATWIITAFVVIDTLMERLGHRSDVRAKVPDSEILTIAVVAAKYFGNHHERAVQIMHGCGYLSGRISVTRFNRRLHQLADGMAWIPDVLGEVFTTGDVSSSIASPCQSAVVCAPGAVGRRRGANSAGIARRNGEVLWMAFASGLPPGWRARARADAARRGARLDPSP